MVFVKKIMYGHAETQLARPHGFSIYQQMTEATGNTKKMVLALTHKI
jgi:hypothetical protein